MNSNENETLIAVITGASSGIGRATALELASRGLDVVLTARDVRALEEVAAQCREHGVRTLVVAADVAREQEVEGVARRAVASFGRIDVWVNAAAVALFGRFDLTPSAQYRRVLETNLFGYIHGARAAMKEFRRRERGILINIGSVVARAPQPFTSAYVTSKAAVHALTASLRMELSLDKRHQIHVCEVLPAAIDTPLFQHAANYTGRAIKALNPVYEPEQVARAVADLIDSPKAQVIVGGAGKTLVAQATAAPRVWEKLGARIIDRDHFQKRSAPNTEGNLHASMEPQAVRGGWREHPETVRGGRRGPLTIAVAAVAVFGAIYAARRYGRD
ncbi:MAG TPA: SDR family oxidoreductase [Thermoanaerobaculia bacterium]